MTNAKAGVDRNYTKLGFNFYSLEINPGILFRVKRLNLGIQYRITQIKRIDKILFNNLIQDPRTDQKFELFNPFKLWFSIGYQL